MRGASLASAAAIGVCLWTLVAGADVAPVVVEVRAASDCIAEPAFLEAVRVQTQNLHAPAPGRRARRIVIVVNRDGARFLGQLRVEELDGSSSVREVTANRCADLSTALALVAALAIDAGPPAAPAPSPQPPVRQDVAKPPVTNPPRPAPPRSEMRIEIGALASVASAVAPTASLGVEPFFDWSAWGRRGLAPSLRIALALRASTGGEASFRWAAARLSGCPLAVVAGQLTARPCAGIDLGLVHAEGSHVARAFSATRPWVAPTLAGRAQVALVPRLYVDLEAGIAVPIVRDRFVFEAPAIDVHDVPPVGGFGAVGFGATFR